MPNRPNRQHSPKEANQARQIRNRTYHRHPCHMPKANQTTAQARLHPRQKAADLCLPTRHRGDERAHLRFIFDKNGGRYCRKLPRSGPTKNEPPCSLPKSPASAASAPYLPGGYASTLLPAASLIASSIASSTSPTEPRTSPDARTASFFARS